MMKRLWRRTFLLIQETLEAIEEAKNKTGNADQEVLFGGLEEKLKELASLHKQRLMAKQKVHQKIPVQG